MKIAVVHGNDGSDVRIGKVCRSLSRYGFEVTFIGWNRAPNSNHQIDLGGANRDVLNLYTKHGRGTIKGYFVFGRFIAKTLKRIRPDICVVVNEDLALFVLPFKGVYFQTLVIDVFDSLVDRHDGRTRFLVLMLKMIERFTRGMADRLIATDEKRFERFGVHKNKTVVIQNYPEDPGDELWRTIPDGNIKIYVAGTLTEGNGLRKVLSCADRCPELRIISAGWLRDEFANEVFSRHPSVDYRGVVTLKTSLEYAAECDAVFIHYQPSSTNSRMASPNKIFDALSVGRPVIVNEESGVGEWVSSNQLGFVVAYADLESLVRVVNQLKEFRNQIPEFGFKARSLFQANYTWNHMEVRLVEMYHGVSTVSSQAK